MASAASPDATITNALPKRRSESNETLYLVLGFVALVCVAAASIWLVGRNGEFYEEVSASLESRSALRRTLSLAQDAETGQRGYLLTGNPDYLTPYRDAVASVADRMDQLDRRVGVTEAKRAEVAELKLAIRFKLQELAETVALQDAGRHDDALAMVQTNRGREAMLQIRDLSGEMIDAEDRKIVELTAAARRNSTLSLVVTILGLALAAALGMFAQVLVRRQTASLQVAQIELEQANTGLEAAVAERTADLVSANQEIQRFAYIVSHDLRAPLVNVMGFTSELDAARKTLKQQIDGLDEANAAKVSPDARAAIEEDLPEAIEFIRTSTAKMDRLINAILRLSREGQRVIKPESVSVEELVKGVADTIYQQMQAAEAEISVEPGLPPLVSDKFSVEQIFQNLIENAVKYLDRSRPGRIVVAGRRVGAMVEYAIEDNGRGIDPKDHERVFELFRRAGAQDQKGEGLGLAFVRASVRRLGGTIRLTSEPGRGSTFHLTFPAVFRPPSESRAA